MSAPVKKGAAPAAPEATGLALQQAADLASIAVSWANDRIMPMLQALRELATYTSDDAIKCNTRLALIRDIANEADILANDMAGCLEREESDLREELAKLEGGAA